MKRNTESAARTPNGWVVLLGGTSEDGFHLDTMQKARRLAGRAEADRVLLVPAATNEAEKVLKKYFQAFDDGGKTVVRVLDPRSPSDAEEPHALELLGWATILVFTGGDQLRLLERMSGSAFVQPLCERSREGLVVVGSSAGAMVLGDPVIVRGEPAEFPFYGTMCTLPGFGLLPGVVVDTHVATRARLGRLLQVVSMRPETIGIGIDENTAVFVSPHGEVSVAGSGLAAVIDGSEIGYTNLGQAREGDVIAAENLKVHLLREGTGYSLPSRSYKQPDASVGAPCGPEGSKA